MEFFKNISPYEVVDTNTFVNHFGNKISSKAIIDKEHIEMRFFSASKGEEIDKEIYNEETIFFCLSGKLKILYKDIEEVVLNSGEIFVLESNIAYGIEAVEETKYFNILVK